MLFSAFVGLSIHFSFAVRPLGRVQNSRRENDYSVRELLHCDYDAIDCDFFSLHNRIHSFSGLSALRANEARQGRSSLFRCGNFRFYFHPFVACFSPTVWMRSCSMYNAIYVHRSFHCSIPARSATKMDESIVEHIPSLHSLSQHSSILIESKKKIHF